MSRGTDLAPMAVRMLSTALTDEGLAAFAVTLDERLAIPGGSVDLAQCREIILANPSWLSGPSNPELPGFATREMDRNRFPRRRRRAAA